VVLKDNFDKNVGNPAQSFQKRIADLRKFLKSLGPDGECLANALPSREHKDFKISPENLKIN
jgi:hypothetical protein